MKLNLNAADVKVVSANMLAGVQVDSSTANTNVDLYRDVNPPVYRMTGELTANIAVGLNVRNARRGDRLTLVRDAATPGAFTVTVKSGTAAGGNSIGVLVASKNGQVVAEWDGSTWKLVQHAHTS